jgi:hypothetical protein
MLLWAADCGDEMLAIDEGGSGVAVAGGARSHPFLADEDGSEILDVVGAPDDFAVGGVQALQFAATGLDVDAIAVDDRRAARAGGALAVFMHFIERDAPEDGAVGGVGGVDDFLAVLVVEIENFSGADDGGGDAIA